MMRSAIWVTTALFLATPALAQSHATAAEVQVDPARLSIANRVTGRLVPPGIYKKLMSGSMDGIMKGVMDQIGAMPVGQLAKLAGVDEGKVADLPEASMGEVMAILDPAFRERTDISMKVMFAEMGDLMGTMEPELRAGMAEAYAKRFSTAQLEELDRFFASPTGTLYANEQMTLMMDPAVMSRMQALVPRLIEAMPAMIKKVEAATASLPKPRKPGDLTADQKKRLDAIFGKGERE